MSVSLGEKFNRWVILDFKIEDYHKKAKVLCDCGTIRWVRLTTLVNGESRSCGCLQKEEARCRVLTHGLSGHHLFQVWYDMNRRCSDERRKDYKHYGGRGIFVCDDWRPPTEVGFISFLKDMEGTYKLGLELDRVNVDGNYEPNNCRWVPHRKQVINRRQTGGKFDAKYITYKDETRCISEWAEILSIPSKVLVDRLGKLKWSVLKAFTTKYKPMKTRN